MKGKHTTKEGLTVEVLDFDSTNKIAYTDFGAGEIRWVGEQEYKEWDNKEEEISEVPYETVTPVTENENLVIEDQPKEDLPLSGTVQITDKIIPEEKPEAGKPKSKPVAKKKK